MKHNYRLLLLAKEKQLYSLQNSSLASSIAPPPLRHHNRKILSEFNEHNASIQLDSMNDGKRRSFLIEAHGIHRCEIQLPLPGLRALMHRMLIYGMHAFVEHALAE